MTAEELRAAALGLPGVVEGFNMGSPVFKANGKVLARLLGEGEAMLSVSGLDERDLLLQARPDVFHITEHYRTYPAVMVRLASLDAADARGLLERRWREIAAKAAVRAFDAAKPA